MEKDLSDAAAYRLLERIAEKSTEPFRDDADPHKTLGQCREEAMALILEAIEFVRDRRTQSHSKKDR